MAALKITPKEKPAAVDRDGLNFVWTTTRLNSGKDNRYDLLHQPVTARKPR